MPAISDYAGALQHVVLSRTLWLLLAPLLAGCAWHLGVAFRLHRSGATDEGSSRAVGMMVLGVASGTTLGHVLVLPPGGALVQPFATGVRVGWLDAGFALCLDRLAAVWCVLSCIVALVVGMYFAARPSGGSFRVWVWIELALGGALLTCLADGLLPLTLGWSLAAASAAWLAGWANPGAAVSAATRSAAAIAALWLGGSLLFWGLGGSWSADDYVHETPPLIVPMPRTEAAASSGSVSLASLAGALVYIDDARTPAAVAPFAALPFPPGRHTLRIHGGAATNDLFVDVLTPTEGESVALVPTGPSLSLRELAVALALDDHTGGALEVRDRLKARSGPGGIGVVTGVLAAWALAAWLIRCVPAGPAAPLPLVVLSSAATGLVVGPVLLLRAAVLLPLAPRMTAALAAALAFSLWSAASTLRGAVARGALDEQAYHAGPSIERALGRTGAILVRFEHWVVDSATGAATTMLGALAWIAARVDVGAFVAPADAIATRAARLGSSVHPAVGVPLSRIAWTFLTVVGLAAVAHAMWPGR